MKWVWFADFLFFFLLVRQLQLIQNAVAYGLTKAWRVDHIALLLRALSFLAVTWRVDLKGHVMFRISYMFLTVIRVPRSRCTLQKWGQTGPSLNIVFGKTKNRDSSNKQPFLMSQRALWCLLITSPRSVNIPNHHQHGEGTTKHQP